MAERVGTPTDRVGLLDVATLLLVALVFSPAFVGIARTWLEVEYLSYGILVAPLCLYLAWWKRPALRRLPARRDLRGGVVLLLALAVFFVGYLADLLFVQGLGMVLGLAATVWLLKGLRWLRELAFPLGYLLFVVPPPQAILGQLTTGLRLFVTSAALALLHRFELPVASDGNVIVLPRDTLFVADACSGIASVLTLIPAAVLLAYFTQRSWPGRLLLVASVVPIAMFWNFARVIGTVLGSLEWGADQVAGPAHEMAGLITFTLGCLTLLAVDSAFRRIGDRGAVRAPL